MLPKVTSFHWKLEVSVFSITETSARTLSAGNTPTAGRNWTLSSSVAEPADAGAEPCRESRANPVAWAGIDGRKYSPHHVLRSTYTLPR